MSSLGTLPIWLMIFMDIYGLSLESRVMEQLIGYNGYRVGAFLRSLSLSSR
jgi:hypothetical protein